MAFFDNKSEMFIFSQILSAAAVFSNVFLFGVLQVWIESK